MAGWLQWRAIFVVFGAVGVLWAVGWYAWFRDEPREHAAVSAEERDHIEATRGARRRQGPAGSWTAVFKTPTVAPLCVQAFANSYGFYFFITWLPTYLAQAHGMKGAELAIFSGLPLMLSFVADLTGGEGSDKLARRIVRCAPRGGPSASAAMRWRRSRFSSPRNSQRLCGGPVHRHRRRLFDADLGAGLGQRGRCGRPPCRRDGGGDEHGGPGGRHPQPASCWPIWWMRPTTGILPLMVLAGIYAVAGIAWLAINPDQRVETAAPAA